MAINQIFQRVGDKLEFVGEIGSGGAGANAEELAAISAVANEANGNAATAIEKAREAGSQASDAQALANTAKSTADTVSATVNNATTGLAATRAIADSAKTTADSAKSVAEAALPKAGGQLGGNVFINVQDAPVSDNAWDRAECGFIWQNKGAKLGSAKFYCFASGKNAIRFELVANNASNFMSFNANPNGDMALYIPAPDDNYKNDEVITAAWARSHFIEQPTTERIAIFGSGDSTLPAGGTWAYWCFKSGTTVGAKGVSAGGAKIYSSGQGYTMGFAIRVA